jgi:hypothetical protein
MEEIKYLVELERYKMKKRKNDSTMVKWEDQQLELMRDNQWIGSKFVVLVFYGEFTEECDISVTNRSAPFDSEHFEKRSKELD